MNHLFKIPVIVFFLISSTLCLTSCKKKPTLPVVTTANVTGITQTTATTGGNVTSDGGAEVTARGVCWGISHNPATGSSETSDGAGTGTFTSSITGLTANTTYYVRAYATNSEGTSYGNEVAFSSNPVLLATITTMIVSSITTTSAVSGGSISADGGGTIFASGVCWSTNQNPTTTDSKTSDGSGTGSFISNITGLTANTTYYVRAYATNSAGTAYGNQQYFTTVAGIGAIIFNPNLSYGTVSDIDGNNYKTIQIGTQIWMAENLKTTKLNDGSAIHNVTDFSTWDTLTTPGYCWYNNDAKTYKVAYGALYNGFTVETGKLCPSDWHVPTNDEWTTLETFLGGSDVAGGKLKEISTVHWISTNTDATNESGFTALPGAQRDIQNDFGNNLWIGTLGQWWSSTSSEGWFLDIRELHPELNSISGSNSSGIYINEGISVRCLKNN
jgi:uncharacterized protein (TIGR02145 family)